MNTADLFLILRRRDDKRASCRGRFIVSFRYLINTLIVITCFLAVCFDLFKDDLNLKPINISKAAKIQTTDSQINKEIRLIDWLNAKSAKYAKYKINYPNDGIVHAKGFTPVYKGAVRVNILEISQTINPNLVIKPMVASKYLNSRVKIRQIAQKNNSIAAINGGYFKPQTGVPLGALIIDNEVYTGPIYNRAAIGINSDGTYSIGKTNFKFFLKNRKYNLKIDNINQPRMLSTYTLLYTERWGLNSPPPPKYGLNAVIKDGKVLGFYNASVQIPNNGYVISAPKKALLGLNGQKNLKLDIIYPDEFKESVHVISGGPYLVKDGEIYIDTKEEKLQAINGANPRTLIGYTKDNDFIMVTVDGRESHSVGMNLYEAAKFMKSLGCINAINLDGGSSSVMYLNGKITNTPPQDGGIPISGALTVGLNSAFANEQASF